MRTSSQRPKVIDGPNDELNCSLPIVFALFQSTFGWRKLIDPIVGLWLFLASSSFYFCPQYWQGGGAGQPLPAPSGHWEVGHPSRVARPAAASNRRGEEETWYSEDEEQAQTSWERTGQRRPQTVSYAHINTLDTPVSLFISQHYRSAAAQPFSALFVRLNSV